MSSHQETIETLRAEKEAWQREKETWQQQAAEHRRQVAELEQALSAEREKYGSLRNVLDRVPSVIYVYDFVEHQTLYINRELLDLLGYSPEEIQAMGSSAVSTLLHPDDVVLAFNRFARLATAADGEVVAIEYRIRHRSGEWCWFHDRAVPHVRGPDGKTIQMLATIQDITEQKKAEEAQQATQDFLQAFMDHTPAVMFAKDRDGRMVLTNSQFDAFLGGEKGAFLGKTDYDYFPAEVADALRAADMQVLETGKLVQTDDVVPHPEGPRSYLSVKFPIYNSQGEVQAIGCSATEITALKQAEASRAALQTQIIEAQKATIRELVTPLLPLADGVVAMPIVGSIDSTRAQQIIETLLQGICAHQAAIAIIDITGVRVVDSQVAQTLVQSAQAAKLLGAQVVLTGIHPVIAQTLVHLDADLSGMVTEGTLQNGIAYALKARGAARATRAG